jgi:hypothetical protein
MILIVLFSQNAYHLLIFLIQLPVKKHKYILGYFKKSKLAKQKLDNNTSTSSKQNKLAKIELT